MARPLRIEYPGAYYHVINRGNAGANIFKANRDREVFLAYLETAVERFGIVIHSYCLMTNHYHLLIETPQANLSATIQWLNVSYATWFNKKRKRQGHLFQGRFKAILVDADEYLTQVSRYIHLNPVRAKMVDTPQAYTWSSYPVFIGETEKPDWLNTSLLTFFGKQRKTAINNYRSSVEETDMETLKNPDSLSVGGCILGGSDFVRWIQDNFLSDGREDKDIPQLKKLKPAISPERIIETVADVVGCNPADILAKGRKRNQSRDIAIYLTIRHSRISCTELGRYFGKISGAAISSRGKQCANKAEQDKGLRELIDCVEKKIIDN
ncbi:MAG: transposase [Thermodesulfobacteriota bacterium]|nr:transposase [Thermodesulfobacteriota bacterium]